MSCWIIDSHMHVGGNPSYLSMDLSLEALLAQMDYLDIERAISANSLSLRDEFEQGVLQDLEWNRQSNGRIYSYFCFGPKHPDKAIEVIRKYHHNPVFRGIKIHPSSTAVDADDEAWRPCWEVAKELHLPIMAHTWNISYYHASQKSAFAGKFEKYVSEYPEVSFTFGHSGGRWDGIVEAARIGRQYKNCYFDIAGDILGNGVLEYLVDNVGADRIIYGSDTYMIEHRPMLGVVIGSRLSNADKEKILRYNALGCYFSDIQ